MTPRRFEQINALADAALGMPVDRRAQFLAAACSGDEELRARVEELILAENNSAGFLESPVLDLLARDLAASRPLRDLAGREMGRYSVISHLGWGGIGDVWLAWDDQLHRQIALKLLLPGYAGDPSHVRRFQHEARAASGLNHPNIVTIHDIGEVEGMDFIAQEFVQGQTLRQRISSGPMPMQEALEMGVQVAAALQAAHGAGIVHRDIKPENVMVRPDGLVKVLDFGLATFTEQAQLSGANLSRDFSRPGVVIGTVKYMSPEQARGLPVDARSDIFSLGIVLYEITTGVAPFTGETPSDTMAAILEHEPPPIASGAAISAGFERIIRKCLRKNRDERYASVAELRQELAHLAGATDSRPEAALHTPRFTPRSLLAAIALLLVAAALALWWRNGRDLSEARFTSMKITRPAIRGNLADGVISADGKYLAYVLNEAAGQSIWVSEMATASDLRTVAPEPGPHTGLAFSPDSAWLYYSRSSADGNRSLYRIPVLGGDPVKVMDDVTGSIAFSRSGRQFAFVRLISERRESSIMVANSDGSGAHVAAVRRRPEYFNYRGVAWSPDERSIACFAGNATSYTNQAFHLMSVDLSGGGEKPLTAHTWAWADSIVWRSNGTVLVNASERSENMFQIWKVSLAGGSVSRITNDLERYARLSITADGKTLAAAQIHESTDLWVANAGGDAAQVTSGTLRGMDSLNWTPDGRIAYSAQAGDFRNISIMDAQGGNSRQVTVSPGDKLDMMVTPNARSIVYHSEGKIWRVDANGRNPVQLTNGAWDVHPSVSTDGRSVYYTSFRDWSPEIGGVPEVWVVPTDGGDARQITHESTSLPKISADGKRLACICYPAGDPRFSPFHLCVFDLDASPARKIFDTPVATGIEDLAWAANGTAIEYGTNAGAGNVWRQSLDGGTPSQITHFTTGELFRIARSKDGAKLGILRGSNSRILVLITDFE